MTSELLDEIYKRAEDLSKTDLHPSHVVELLEVYVKSRPQHGRAWSLYGAALKDLSRNKESLQALITAYKLAPETYKGFVAMQIAVLVQDFQSPKEALPWFETGCKHADIDHGWPWILKGANLMYMEEFDAAISCFEIALREDHHLKDESYFNLGLAYRAQGRYEQAIDSFKSALQINPAYEEAINALAGMDNLPDTFRLIAEYRKNYGEIH
ncbi:hypothetical protein UNDYM_3445 [Undibacterium sp. YM2]|uniref:tetratricopeptide repeat protein n=1 Tax=Undibacterium sp. YM2 TaxID=2058625 RepID=UPI001331CBFC|nr:tetratricopeptide repeat protein [Undibacterium sp. YM2]BBB67698.1 hypothetical protein UNDYM_3445 [Undibacterium sp. YM2]